MNWGLPRRKEITNRGTSINYGGDGRYIYVLCPRARTVSVYDTNPDIGTISGVARTGFTSIALNASNTYTSIVYRSVGLQVWVFSNADVKIIDANPASGTFNTVIETITTTIFNVSGAVTYVSDTDNFYFNSGYYNASIRVSIPTKQNPNYARVGAATNTGYYPQIAGIINGGANGECSFISSLITEEVIVALGNTLSTFTNYKIGNKNYNGSFDFIGRFSMNGNVETSIALPTNSPRGDVAYNPTNKRLLIGNYNATTCVVIGINPFASIGSIQTQLNSILASNGFAYSSIIYSPFSGKIYIKSISTTGNLTGCNRVYIVDTTQALGSMVCGYFTCDAGDWIAGRYNNTYMCCNQLRVQEYE
jgi:hypothetical protein